MNKKFFSGLVLLFLLGAFAFWKLRPEGNSLEIEAAKEERQDWEKVPPRLKAPPSVSLEPAKAEGVKPEFVRFIKVEAKAMDAPKMDAEAAEKRAIAEAESMGEKEIQFTRNTALSSKTPTGEKIFAVYLLGLLREKGWPALQEVILAPMPPPGEVHSAEEIAHNQAGAYQRMAVDSLVEQAVSSAAARAFLEQLAEQTPEESLRRYIEGKLKELPSL